MNNIIGVTERGDPVFDLNWLPWVRDGKPAIIITKDPTALYDMLTRIKDSQKFNVIVHATITGYGGTAIEPNVPGYAYTLAGYRDLCNYFSEDRVVLRIDPIIPTKSGIETAKMILGKARVQVHTRVRISFIDQYPHVIQRGFSLPWTSFHAPLELRKDAWSQLGEPEICGEPDFKCTGCVSEIDCKILNVEPIDIAKGQRQYCACLANKKELLTSRKQCAHSCIYCYWKE